jgi:hypothetical protein
MAWLQDISAKSPWPGATVARVRDVILNYGITAMEPPPELQTTNDIRSCVISEEEVTYISELCLAAVNAGRLIDFGYLPNEVIKQGGHRGGPLYNIGGLGHPFRDAWIFLHAWEEGAAVYLVHLRDKDRPNGGRFEAAELCPVRLFGKPALVVSDRILLDSNLECPDKRPDMYVVAAVPSAWRFVPGCDVVNLGMTAQLAATCNVLDPVMTALLVLNTPRGLSEPRCRQIQS